MDVRPGTRSKARRLVVVGALLALTSLAVYGCGEIYKRRDWLPYFREHRTELASVEETPIERHPTHRLLHVTLHGESGLRVGGHLKVPTEPLEEAGPRPVLITLGGLETGRLTIDYLSDTGNWLILALDYPWHGPTDDVGDLEFLTLLPQARRAMLDTVPAGMLALDYLWARGDVDPRRVVVAGGSLGALFAPALAATDPRVSAAAIFFGAGDLETLIRANIDAPWGLRGLATWIGSVVVSPLEPLKYVHRISPRPLFLLSGSEDDSMPEAASRALHERAGEPKTVRWLPLGHVNVRETEFHLQVLGVFIDWLREIDYLEENETFELKAVEERGGSPARRE